MYISAEASADSLSRIGSSASGGSWVFTSPIFDSSSVTRRSVLAPIFAWMVITEKFCRLTEVM
ncbi:hypothetical protein D9M71_157760 [compost metagenome]